MYFKGCYWPEPNNLITNIFERMSDNINAGGTVETPTVESLQAQLQKAEAKIVDLKKSTKETTTTEETPKTEPIVENNNNYMTRDDYAKEEFFRNNPELLEHKDAISEKVSKWYSLDDAKTVLLSQDKTIEARKNTQNSNFTAWSGDYSKSSYTSDDLEKLSQREYNQVMTLQEQGKVIIT